MDRGKHLDSLGVDSGFVRCCRALTTPSKPYATGETDAERLARFAKECAAMGKVWTGGQCINKPVKAMGKARPPKTGKPISPALWEAAKAKCESRGPGYKYDPQTNSCELKQMGKAKPQGASEQAEEETTSKEPSDEPKKKKKKAETTSSSDESYQSKNRRSATMTTRMAN